MTAAACCTSFSSCSAALCPAREDWLAAACWSLPEPICARRWPGGGPRWLRTQKRMAARLPAAGVRDCGLWTWRMLARLGAVTRHVRGLGPDDGDAEEAAWLAAHPARAARPAVSATAAQLAARAAFAAARRAAAVARAGSGA